jgi:hypothetical protein
VASFLRYAVYKVVERTACGAEAHAGDGAEDRIQGAAVDGQILNTLAIQPVLDGRTIDYHHRCDRRYVHRGGYLAKFEHRIDYYALGHLDRE